MAFVPARTWKSILMVGSASSPVSVRSVPTCGGLVESLGVQSSESARVCVCPPWPAPAPVEGR